MRTVADKLAEDLVKEVRYHGASRWETTMILDTKRFTVIVEELKGGE